MKIQGIEKAVSVWCGVSTVYIQTSATTFSLFYHSKEFIQPHRDLFLKNESQYSEITCLHPIGSMVLVSSQSFSYNNTWTFFNLMDSNCEVIQEMSVQCEFRVKVNPIHLMRSIFVKRYRIVLASEYRERLFVIAIFRRKLYLLTIKSIMKAKNMDKIGSEIRDIVPAQSMLHVYCVGYEHLEKFKIKI